MSLVFGHMATHVVGAAARLGVADVIGDGECTGAVLAARLGVDRVALARVLRTMVALGLLSEPTRGTYRLTEAGALLRTDHADSLHPFVTMATDRDVLSAWFDLDTTVRTGTTAFERVFGVSFGEHMSANPWLSQRFHESLRWGAARTAELVIQHYDLRRFSTVADVGGRDGTLLAVLLAREPRLRGIVYDTLEPATHALTTLTAAGVADRCATTVGDILSGAPAGADLYLLRAVARYRDDDEVYTILGNIRAAMPAHGRVLLIEPILPTTVDGSVSTNRYLSDLNMLVNFSGRERTHSEFRQLLARAGFAPPRVTALPAPSESTLIEAAPA